MPKNGWRDILEDEADLSSTSGIGISHTTEKEESDLHSSSTKLVIAKLDNCNIGKFFAVK